MVKVRKRDGKLQRFRESKIVRACKRAGATAKQATYVALDVSFKVAKLPVVTAVRLSKMVGASLRKVNKKAANAFVRFRNKK